jgi:predicted nuclease of restriction endonuclease-like (RecB) superfamily
MRYIMDLDISVKQFIAEIKEKVRAAQYDALKAVNVQLIRLYWELGKSISEKQEIGWGKAIVPTLSKELQKEFPNMGGLSVGNLWLMAQFYTEYQTDENLVPLVREISWSKHVVIFKKCKNICKSKDRTIVEYSLKTAILPIGVATYNTSNTLPIEYRKFLPSVEEISQKMLQFLNSQQTT